jgi:hypothetical protein
MYLPKILPALKLNALPMPMALLKEVVGIIEHRHIIKHFKIMKLGRDGSGVLDHRMKMKICCALLLLIIFYIMSVRK